MNLFELDKTESCWLSIPAFAEFFDYNLFFYEYFPGTLRTHLATFFLSNSHSPNYNPAYLEESAKFTAPFLLLPSQPSWICCRKISCPERSHKFPTGFG